MGLGAARRATTDELPEAVESALFETYLQLRAGILLEGAGRLLWDRHRFRHRGLAIAALGGCVAETWWFATRARRGRLVATNAVYVDFGVTTLVQILSSVAMEPSALAEGMLYADFLSVWACTALAGWAPSLAVGSGATAAACALQCSLIARTGRLTAMRVSQEAMFHGAFYAVGRAFVGMVRRYVDLTLEAEAEARRAAGEAARAETRSELHRTVHRQTVETLRALSDVGADRRRPIARIEAVRLRRALSAGSAASSIDDLLDECAAMGVRFEFVETSNAVMPTSIVADLAILVRAVAAHAAAVDATSAILTVGVGPAAVDVTIRTRVPIARWAQDPLQTAVTALSSSSRGRVVTVDVAGDYGTRVAATFEP